MGYRQGAGPVGHIFVPGRVEEGGMSVVDEAGVQRILLIDYEEHGMLMNNCNS